MTTGDGPNHSEHAWMTPLGGRFIVFDGPDGSGKSTQFRRFCAAAESAGVTLCDVREPGGTEVGERIRAILLDPIHSEMTVRTEMMLYMASRAQLVQQRIVPALAAGHLVIADRFISSTLAYQGSAGGLPREEIVAVGKAACGGVEPDLVVIFDVDDEVAASRLNPLLDRMEQKGAEFHRKVRQGYLSQVREWPDRYAVVDASQDADAVTRDLLAVVRQRLVRPPVAVLTAAPARARTGTG